MRYFYIWPPSFKKAIENPSQNYWFLVREFKVGLLDYETNFLPVESPRLVNLLFILYHVASELIFNAKGCCGIERAKCK
jgi:hypothetical protein